MISPSQPSSTINVNNDLIANNNRFNLKESLLINRDLLFMNKNKQCLPLEPFDKCGKEFLSYGKP